MTNLVQDPIFWLIAVIGLVLTGISKSGFAGGAGVVAVPLLSLKVGVLEATAITLPLLLLMDAKTLRYYWSHINWNELKRLLPGAFIGILLGGLSMGSLPERWLLIGLGVLSILFATWASLQTIFAKLTRASWFWSTTSGLTSTLVHAGGPPINIYFISRRLEKLPWLATAAAFFAIMNVVKLIPYTLNEQWSKESFIISALLFPIALFGVWLGKGIQQRLSEQTFMQACRALLLLSGIGLIVKAI
jgi:uncharacterized membrane protein YfcA